MAKEPTDAAIFHAIDAAGRLVAYLNTDYGLDLEPRDLLDVAALANVGLTRDAFVSAYAYAALLGDGAE